MEQTFKDACARRTIPGVVLQASDSEGSFKYAGSFGVRSLNDAQPAQPLKEDAIHHIASCVKLITAVAVMQCVENGKLSLDDDVSTILYEFKDIDILTGYDKEGRPQYKKATRKITLRHLMTHSSGLSYDLFDPKLMEWRASQNQKIDQGQTIPERYFFPLLYEPGTAWMYSVGVDWAGLMVERVNGGIALGDYMEANIWRPLGINDMTFHLEKREDLRLRLADMHNRDPLDSNGKAMYIGSKSWDDPIESDFGGIGLFSSAPDYLKILQSLLADDGKLLESASIEEMFRPQLTDASRKALNELLEDPEANASIGDLPLGVKKDYGIGGLLLMEDLPNSQRKGTMLAGGLPNLFWWIDRSSDLCGFYASQILPVGDLQSRELKTVFQKEMYSRRAQSNAQL